MKKYTPRQELDLLNRILNEAKKYDNQGLYDIRRELLLSKDPREQDEDILEKIEMLAEFIDIANMWLVNKIPWFQH